MEFAGGTHRVLADHGVGDEQHFAGLQFFFQHAQLIHQIIIDVQAAGGVHQDHVAGGKLGFLDGAFHDFDRLVRAGAGPDRRAHGFRDLGKLFARGGTIDVSGNHQRTMAVLRKPFGELSGGGGFAGTLQPNDHPHRRRARSEDRLGVLAENGGELIADNFDDLLIGRKLQKDFAADGFPPDVG